MHGTAGPANDRPIDGGQAADWGRTAADYVACRPGYPESFFRRLEALDVVRAGLRLLDLGTGPGTLALALATRGLRATGIDIAPGAVEAARRLAAERRLAASFLVAPAETTGLPAASFDLVAASQCWLYFDKARVIPEVRRLLAPGGRLLTCHLCYLSDQPIARETEDLILRYNPQWTGARWDPTIPAQPAWSAEDFTLCAMFYYDEPIEFTREGWRGRMRACRGVGASLPDDEVRRLDADLAILLDRIAPPTFPILHRIDAHVFEPR